MLRLYLPLLPKSLKQNDPEKYTAVPGLIHFQEKGSFIDEAVAKKIAYVIDLLSIP